jgi:hypothetical protein
VEEDKNLKASTLGSVVVKKICRETEVLNKDSIDVVSSSHRYVG